MASMQQLLNSILASSYFLKITTSSSFSNPGRMSSHEISFCASLYQFQVLPISETSNPSNELDQLVELHLEHNSLTAIANLSFSSLGKLKKLTLSYNVILNIESSAFYGLRSLEVLDLQHNNIKAVDLGHLPLGVMVNLKANAGLQIHSLHGLENASPNVYQYRTWSHGCAGNIKGNNFICK